MPRKVLSERSILIVCIALGVAQVWINRYAMVPDGISYLDIGDAYFRRDWAAAINSYWSPLYSWFLGLGLYLVKPTIRWEFITVHVVNFLIYLICLFSFRFFMHSLLRALRNEKFDTDDSLPLPEWVLLGLGYSVFLWAALVLIDAGMVTPDLLVAAIFFLIGAYLADLRHEEDYGKFAMFGVLCGVAYLGKAIMFPLGFGFLTILLFSGRVSKRRVSGVLLSTFLFLLVCLPFIAMLSKATGRITFGDSGRLAYASMVSPEIPQIHWQGEPAGSGVPKHGLRAPLEHPPVFEFATPVAGTYPPLYGEAYWNEGARARFRLRSQIRVLVQSARNYTQMLGSELGLLGGLLTFVFWGGAASRRAIAANWPLIATAGLSLAAYSLVLVRSRYVGASMVLLLVAILAGIRLPRNAFTTALANYVVAGVMATVLFSVVAHLADSAYLSMTVYGFPTSKDQMAAAEELRNMGLQVGDRLAIIGDGSADYWARLGRFKIVAEVFSPDAGSRQFWSEPRERRSLAYEYLRRSGAKTVVVWNPPESSLDQGWKQIPNTNYYVRFLTE